MYTFMMVFSWLSQTESLAVQLELGDAGVAISVSRNQSLQQNRSKKITTCNGLFLTSSKRAREENLIFCCQKSIYKTLIVMSL